MKILIVDDNKENIYLLEILLAGKGYEVVSAFNGAEAMEILEKQNFQLIISDILMPVIDGFQFCRLAKKDKKLKKIPFIFYTATYTDKKDEQFALKLGANVFIRKPAEPDVFLKIVANVFDDAKTGKVNSAKTNSAKTTIKKEDDIFKLYSERLVQKLEKRSLELEAELKERKKAEALLQDSLAQLNTVFNGVSDGIVLSKVEKDGRYRILNVNEAFAKSTGHKKSELIGKRIDEMLPEQEYSFGKQKCDEAIQSKEPLIYETEYSTARGTFNYRICKFSAF